MQKGKQEWFEVACRLVLGMPWELGWTWMCLNHFFVEEGFECGSSNTFLSTFYKLKGRGAWLEQQSPFSSAVFWRRVLVSAWVLKDRAHEQSCKRWTRCLRFRMRFLCCYRVEFKVGVSCSLPCAISHAAYLLQIPFFCGIQLFSALPIASAWPSTVDSKWEKGKICVFFYSFRAGLHWTFLAFFLWLDLLNHRGHTFRQLREPFQSKLKVWQLLK